MTFTYSLSNWLGKVRLLIPDRASDAFIFTDEELTAFYEMEGSNTKRTAALALETIASDTAMTLKVVNLPDLSTNGPATSDSLLRKADKLRQQADTEDAGSDGGGFDIAEWTNNNFSERERLYKEMQRTL